MKDIKEEQFIDELIYFRKSHNLSQSQMARICKVTQPMIARIENKHCSPNINTIIKLLKPFRKTIKIVNDKEY